MNINSDYSERVVIDHHDLPWMPSPQLGVERRLLERQGDEVAKVTSIVRYKPGSKFQAHHHELGEELFVLDAIQQLAYLSNFNPLLTNWVTFALMSFSALGVIKAVANKTQIQCACLGTVFKLPMSTVTIVEDVGMVLMAVLMLAMI